MVQLLRQKRILLSIALNLVIAFLIAFVSVRLFYNNARHGTYHSLTIIGNHEWASIEIYKPYIFAFFKVFIFSIWLLLLFSYILIKTTRPILEELLLNEKDLISKRKETEKKEKGLITLLKNLPVGLIIYDSKAQITHFNDYAISYLGFATNQIKGLVGPPLHLTGEDGSELPIAEHPVNKVITTRAILKNKVVAIVQPSGNMVWVKYNALPVFNFLGNLKQVILTFLEITDHKHMEVALKEVNNNLQEQSEELTQLLDNLKETNARLTESEARYKLISDFSTGWETFRHPDDLVKFKKHFNNGLTGISDPSFVVRLLHKNQTLKWVESATKPVISEKGELLGTRISIRDITRLKETEIALQESRELLNLIFQYSNDWESYRDKNGKLIYSSLAMQQLLGYQVSEYLSGKINFKDIIHPDDYKMAMSQFERAVSGETIPSLIVRYIHRNKNIVWADLSARPVFSESGEMLGLRFSSKDITQLKENEFKLND